MKRLWRISHKVFNWCEHRRPAGGFNYKCCMYYIEWQQQQADKNNASQEEE
jgi:hypothetical protein